MKNQWIWVVAIIAILVIGGMYLFSPSVTTGDTDGTGIKLHLYDTDGNEIDIPDWFSASSSLDLGAFTIVTHPPAPSCTVTSDCSGYETNPSITCWNQQCSLTNIGSMSMAVSAENTGESALENVHIQTATPSEFLSALSTSSYTIAPGETKSWTSSAMTLSGWEGQVVTFSAVIEGVNSYDGTTVSGNAATTLEFAADPVGGLVVNIVSPI